MNTVRIRNIAIIGSGIMGEGIAITFALAGYSVNILDVDTSRLAQCQTAIKSDLALMKEHGLLNEKPEDIAERVTGIVIDNNLSMITESCEFVMECVPELLDVKKNVFAQLDNLPDSTIIASNTSSFTITTLTDEMKSARRVVGLHFFNPAHIIPSVEIHKGETTDDALLNQTRDLMIECGKKPIMVKKTVPGFVINRLTGAMEREIDYLLDEGIVSPEDLDIAVKGSFGFRLACLGPMEAEDLIGLDTSARSSGNIFKVLSNKTVPSPLLLEKVNRGELGVKSKKGWYDYSGKTREEITNRINRKLLGQLTRHRDAECD